MTNHEFVLRIREVMVNFRTVYMWGVFGSPVSETLIRLKTAQYPKWYTKNRQDFFRRKISRTYFGFDCVNLIKGVLWGWTGDSSKPHGGAIYNSKNVPDINANQMIKVCADVSTDFSKIDVGEVVWIQGHIGVYIGDGKVIEATTAWLNNVQMTACLNIGPVSGLNGRRWTSHGKLPYIYYVDMEEDFPMEPDSKYPPDLSEWATDGYDYVTSNGISDGSKPKEFMTREQYWTSLERYNKELIKILGLEKK